MGRPRGEVLWPPADSGIASVWIRPNRDRGFVLSHRVRRETAEHRFSDLASAITYGKLLARGTEEAPRGGMTIAQLIEAVLDEVVLDDQGREVNRLGWVTRRSSAYRTWFREYFHLACLDLPRSFREEIALAIRKGTAHGRPGSLSLEKSVDGAALALITYGQRHGYFPEDRVFPRNVPKRVRAVRREAGDEVRVRKRDELPTVRECLAFSRHAALYSGVWWDRLRWLLAFFLGPRIGELHALTLDDVVRLRNGRIKLRITAKRNWLDRDEPVHNHTKNFKERSIMVPQFLTPMLRRRLAELETLRRTGRTGVLPLFPEIVMPRARAARARSGIVIEGKFAGKDQLSSQWRNVGMRAGFPVRTWTTTANNGRSGEAAQIRPSSLKWRMHDARHHAATWMLAPIVAGKTLEGLGMDLKTVAYVLGDDEETIRRSYIGHSRAREAAADDALGRV